MQEHKTQVKKVLASVVALMVMLVMFVTAAPTYAATGSGGDPYATLMSDISDGNYLYRSKNKTIDYQKRKYKLQNGGFTTFSALLGTDYTGNTNVFTSQFNQLKNGAKNDFLQDLFTIAKARVNDSFYEDAGVGDTSAPTEDTFNDLVQRVQYESGMGSTILTSLLEGCNPDIATASWILNPFQTVFGTILGGICILIVIFFGTTVALDVAYIAIPAFQLALGGAEHQDGKKKGIAGIVSAEAKAAVNSVDKGGGQGGSGDYKNALWTYVKMKGVTFVVLGAALIFLCFGKLWAIVGFFMDLFSNLLGF